MRFPVAVLALGVACSAPPVPRNVPQPDAVAASAVPGELGGLAAQPEDVEGQFEQVASRAWLSDVKMWSLRQGSELRATVQVGSIARDAELDDEDFRAEVINGVGTTAPRPRLIASRPVWITSGNNQTLAIWFHGAYMVLASVSKDHPQDLGLLRSIVSGVKP